MARGHAVRGMVTAWLGLIVLQTVGTQGGTGRVAGLFTDADRLIKRALSPDIPAIPDRRTGGGTRVPVPDTPTPAPVNDNGGGGSFAANGFTSTPR
jgi:hypothetical protein